MEIKILISPRMDSSRQKWSFHPGLVYNWKHSNY